MDAYYLGLKRAIEYRETQHTKAVAHNKSTLITIGGAHRGEQRGLYDQRRRDVLPANGIRLIEIDHTDLACDNSSRLLRDEGRDRHVIEVKLRAVSSLDRSDTPLSGAPSTSPLIGARGPDAAGYTSVQAGRHRGGIRPLLSPAGTAS